MPLTPNDTATLLARTKGAAASILLAMLCLGKPLARRDLITLTPYSPPSIDRAMRDLETMGIVQRHAGGQWMLTVQGRQFILGEVGLVIESQEQPALPADSCQNTSPNVKSFYIDHGVSNVNLPKEPEQKTSLTDVSDEQKTFTWDDDAEDAMQLLIEAGRWERTKNGKGARDAVETALTAGWTGEQCYFHVRDCLRYARSKAGKGINDPGAWAAYALREQIPTPQYTLERGDPDYQDWYDETHGPESYINGKFGDLIQH